MAENSYLPQTGDDLELIEIAMEHQPDHTYKLDISRGRIKGITEAADALLQAVYLILSVERYQYPIYSYNYGVELVDLVGQPKDFVMAEVKRRITEALTCDDRISRVDNWEFEISGSVITVTFTVHSEYGDIITQKELNV